MKQTIFIDANIFLRFYDTGSKEFKTLLSSIDEIKDNIFLPKQIQDEVNRNKLRIFGNTFDAFVKRFGLNKVTLPEHLETVTDKELHDWNTTTQKIGNQIGEQDRKLKEITAKLLGNISNNNDEVSKLLSKIFSLSKQPTAENILNARGRKEVGNPPGKTNDPLGDQLSWEQLLDNAKNIEELWLITNDGDYIFEFEKKCYLNPFLLEELKERKKDIKINCFNTLSEGLKSFNQSKKIKALPPEEELSKITTEEQKSNEVNKFLTGFFGAVGPTGSTGSMGITSYSGYNPIAAGLHGYSGHSGYAISSLNPKCPICGVLFSTKPTFAPSQLGYLTKQYFCSFCNRNFDTGEPYL